MPTPIRPYSRCGFFDFATGYWHRDGGCTVRAGRTGRRSARAGLSLHAVECGLAVLIE